MKLTQQISLLLSGIVKHMQSRKEAFTLIEILLVITILAVFAGIIFVALNPAKRIKDAKDSRRASDVDSLLTAIHQSIVDNKGDLPAGLDATERQLGTDTTGCTISTGGCSITATSCLDLSSPMTKYLKSIPIDPQGGTAGKTQYSAIADANGIVTVRACGAENSSDISASR